MKRLMTYLTALLFVSTYDVMAVTVTSTSAGGDWNAATSWIGGNVPGTSDDVIINGVINVRENRCNDLTITSVGVLQNRAGYSHTLTVDGSIVNSGSIRTNSGGGSLYIVVQGNLENRNFYSPTSTAFEVGNKHTLIQSQGKYFQGKWVTKDTASGIVLGSFVEFRDVSLVGYSAANAPYYAMIETNGNNAKFGSCNIQNFRFSGKDTLDFQGSELRDIRTFGDLKINGEFSIYKNVQFFDKLTNVGVIKNTAGYGVSIDLKGDFINKGRIENNSNGGSLNLELSGDFHNEGIYTPRISYIRGGDSVVLSQISGKKYQGDFNLADSTSGIVLGSNVVFEHSDIAGDYDYTNKSRALLHTNGYDLNLDTCDLYALRLLGDDTITSKGTDFYHVKFWDDCILDGDLTVYTGVYFIGNITNLGIIQNTPGYGNTSYLRGNMLNKGVLRNNPNGGSLNLELSGDFHNEGVYMPRITYIKKGDSVELSQASGVKYQGDFNLADSTSGIVLGSDVAFEHCDIEGDYTEKSRALLHTNGYDLNLDTCDLYALRLLGDDTITSKGTDFYHVKFWDDCILDGDLTVYTGVYFIGNITNLGIIQNTPGYGNTAYINGNLLNKGEIINNPNGGSLYIDSQSDSLFNEGEISTKHLKFFGGGNHFLSSPTEDISAVVTLINESVDTLVLLSDVRFNKSEVRGYQEWGNINTNGHKLSIDTSWNSRLNIYGSDTVFFGNSHLQYVTFHGKPVIDGLLKLYTDVTFMDDMENIGVLQNREGYGVSTDFLGELKNYGSIITSGGSLSFYLSKGIDTDGNYNPSSTYLIGKSNRSIRTVAQPLLQGKYYVQDTFSLLDEAFLPHLQLNTGALLTIDTNASLIIGDYYNGNNDDRIINLNRISVKKPVDNYYDKYYRAKAYFKQYNDLGDLEVETYCNQQHPSTADAIPMWWRFKPDTTDNIEVFNYLELYYEPKYLSGLEEDSIRVFFSPNAGLNWEEVTEGKSIDTATNKITIDEAQAYGHYVLSSSALGVVSFEPLIQRAEPKIFGDKGSVTLYGFGLGFNNEMTVYLTNGTDKIYADTSYITDALGESFLTTFRVERAPVGQYTMVVQVPGYDDVILSDYFTIEEAERPDPWVMLTGRDRFLVNRFQTFKIHLGNRSNMDAQAVPLFFLVNDVPGMEVVFPDINIGIQKSFTDDGWTQFRDTTIELFYVSDSFEGYVGQRMRLYPFIVPSIGAMSADNVRVRIKVPSVANLDMSVWITDPLVEGLPVKLKAGTPPEVAACLAAAASKYYWDKAIGFIPGYDCYKLAYKVGETAVGEVLKDPNEKPKKSTWFSAIHSAWGWGWSIADCAGDLIPISKGLKLGKDLLDIAFDTKSNYDAHQECWEKFKKRKKGKHTSKGVFSFDPNEITGPSGYGPDGYIDPATNMVYTVFFENKDSATAPASEVVVLDTLDKKVFDFSTFSFQDIVISDSTYEIQSFAKEFRVILDLSPRINTLVQVTGSLDTVSGEVRVQYLTLDRSTLELQEDVDLGFLPPNKTKPEGEGNFSYSLALKDGLPHNTYIENKALIFFDANKPIKTNVHYNTVDILPPTSMVDGLPVEVSDSAFNVSWSGVDPGSGIESYTVMVSVNDSDYRVWKSSTSLVSDTFYGRNKTTYKFYSIATDSLQLSEDLRDESDATVYVNVKSGSIQEELNSKFIIVQRGEQIYINTPEKGSMSLYDMNGRLVKEYELVYGQNLLSSSELSAQPYLVEVRFSSATIRKKIALIK